MAEFDALKAKIPGDDTGIQIKNTICAICSPAPHCGLTCYVKDDKVIKVEGWKDHPDSNGGICTKGLSNKEFLYREDRILYPMRRIGERGEGKFERITWEEAYNEIAEKLMNELRNQNNDIVKRCQFDLFRIKQKLNLI